jgi:spermidine/putrescine transport system permease protein
MLRSLSRPPLARLTYAAYVAAFFLYLALPLTVVATFAFNASIFPGLPWQGTTLAWFLGTDAPRIGMFHDASIMRGLGNSLVVACGTTALTVTVGTTTAFLFERFDFRLKNLCYTLMLLPLVIPGVIIGISILSFSSAIANAADSQLGLELSALRPGLWLVIAGQFTFIATIATLVISARLRKFDRSLEEAALNLGASQVAVLRTITLPFLGPAMIGSALVAFLMSFENFNTTLMLVGSDAPLTITMFERMRQGSTPVLNAVSVFLMVSSGLLGLLSVMAVSGRAAQAD